MWVLFLDAVLGSKGGLWLLRTRGEWQGQHKLPHLFWHHTRAVAPGRSTIISQGASDSAHLQVPCGTDTAERFLWRGVIPWKNARQKPGSACTLSSACPTPQPPRRLNHRALAAGTQQALTGSVCAFPRAKFSLFRAPCTSVGIHPLGDPSSGPSSPLCPAWAVWGWWLAVPSPLPGSPLFIGGIRGPLQQQAPSFQPLLEPEECSAGAEGPQRHPPLELNRAQSSLRLPPSLPHHFVSPGRKPSSAELGASDAGASPLCPHLHPQGGAAG